MEVTVKKLFDLNGKERLYATIPVDAANGIVVKPGDYSYNSDSREIFQANQSLCVWCTEKVIGPINENVQVEENQVIDIYFKCKAKEACGYPFCGKTCPGNEGFYIGGLEERGY